MLAGIGCVCISAGWIVDCLAASDGVRVPPVASETRAVRRGLDDRQLRALLNVFDYAAGIGLTTPDLSDQRSANRRRCADPCVGTYMTPAMTATHRPRGRHPHRSSSQAATP